MTDHWQLQEAKQRFSELIRSVETDGPQVVTRHGQEIAVMIDIGEYRHLRGAHKDYKDYKDFKDFLGSAPDLAELEIARRSAPPEAIDLGEGA